MPQAKDKTPNEVKQAIKYLLETLDRFDGAFAAGFVWSGKEGEEFICQFGNGTTGMDQTKLFSMLATTAKQKIATGAYIAEKTERIA